ncbi:methyl-accepting chemotaxis protein [Proteiniborus ethanoligenes]|uniref:Methyl-accepting chemotaxis protein n=1 Tax=Proteiniborus ethanoligenes TaxID=415015 RepID=A0A1H3QAE0_9FIRM|nr:methyl-accepting chemotaxis protein [Proteiniborus ethanoligenes]TAH63633.1 MAG: methyl-accepting chemotaxis protein [Gottschalkiaceae bacterium]SDZ10522.1 methyl-accepting chemotaxis protein [Proteiniborus ethanoligenes]
MKITVAKKILFGFGALVIIIIGIGLLGIYELYNMNDMLNSMYEVELQGISSIKEAQVNLITAHRAEKNLILSQDLKEQANHTENIREYSKRFEEAMKKFEGTIALDDIRQKSVEINRLWEEAKPVQERIIQLNSQGKYDEAFKLSGQNREIFDKIEEYIELIATQKDEQALKAYNDSDAIFNYTTKTVVIILIVCIIISIGAAFIISRLISKPIVAIAKSAEEIANGDLTVESIRVKNNDEIGELAKSFNTMADSLRDMIMKIGHASQSVAAYSQELSASSEETSAATEQVAKTITELSNGAISQSEELESVSSHLGQISATIQQTAANTETVVNESMKASDAANRGVIEVENAVNKIERVKEVSMETANVINALGEQSEQIGQIIDVIKSIADQTNLLALNAAIEAARAGEQGRGFAVVADEVRKLAEESSASTQQIEKLIHNIQNETNKAIDVIEAGSQEIYEGVEAVNKAGDSFKIIVEEIDIVVEQIEGISVATQQIASGSNEIVRSVDSIAAISQQTAASSQEVTAASEEQTAAMEEVASSAQELASLAEELQEIISRFNY